MTYEEAKDQFAQQQNFKDWADYEKFMFNTRVPHNKKELAYKGAAELYARSKWDEACETQIENCVQAYYGNETNEYEDRAIRAADKPLFKP